MPRLMRVFTGRRLAVAAAVLLAAIGYVVYDLGAPRAHDLRRFDPDEVARLETEMWRSYYGRQRVQLFLEMTELLRSQYDLPFVRSNVDGFYAARSAFVFKGGHNREECERALPDLVRYYGDLRAASSTAFDVDRVSRLELEWWIIHRERASHDPQDLANALAALPAAIYGVPPESLMEHARLRAEAMRIRDTEADAGGVSEDDWARIDELLHRSWRSLHAAVNADPRG